MADAKPPKDIESENTATANVKDLDEIKRFFARLPRDDSFRFRFTGSSENEEDVPSFSRLVEKVNREMPTPLRLPHQRYDPYAFLDGMANPFEIPMRDSKKPADDNDHKNGSIDPMPHCKACTDFKTWMALTANPRRTMSKEEREAKECPMDSNLLGRNTWAFLHTMAAYYPKTPTVEQQSNMVKFIGLFSQFYPCHKCASHLREDLKSNRPDTSNNVNLSKWFCELHNSVNVRLGKPEFDCERVLERWSTGWEDGTCD